MIAERHSESADKNDEATMAEIRPFRESTLRQEQDINISIALPVRFCAYNQTGKRFVSNDVEVADASAVSLQDCLSNLNPGSGSAVWIAPIRLLSATDFRFPADLLYLDEECVVREIVQAFPIERPNAPLAGATSILALPAHAVPSAGIKSGDRLVVCAPEEMQHYLLDAPPTEPAPRPRLMPAPGKTQEPQVSHDIDQLWEWEEQQKTSAVPAPETSPADVLPRAVVPEISEKKAEEPATVSWSSTLPEEKSTSKGLWRKLFSKKPTDPRHAQRLALPGLVAYYFTGSTPVAHPVRNISLSGLYVLTSERWYKGTVVRITLTNVKEPTADNSITLHAKVIRYSEDGVALQFILYGNEQRLRGVASTLDHLSGGASIAQVEQFIARYRSGS